MKANVHDESRTPDAPQFGKPGKPASRKTSAPARAGCAIWLWPAALLLLSAIPLTFGAFRLSQLAGGSGPAGTQRLAGS